ncbi:MAG: ATP-dependent RNA helicase [Candidatus Doudnabacteria bacterium]|nr:ATP-dependent RNA helicase [Candidatus Doudnabacteria bacterium]
MAELLILSKEADILDMYADNQVMILVGETGSGKTTRVPGMIYRLHQQVGVSGLIGITQPRKIAAISTATYVAEQIGTGVDDVVAYKIRFEDTTAESTILKFMTDGILLREIQNDPELRNYSTIIVDEAHERSENIDFLLGLLKQLLVRRPDLSLIVMSATIDEKKFSRYFNDAPIINVSGRMYPVEVMWQESDIFEDEVSEAVANKIIEIHTAGKPGDVLAFMTGRDDISRVVDMLEKKDFSNMIVLPCLGELSTADQRKIFDRYLGKRKVVIATNIAETSITVEGIVHVVDGGYIKESNFHSETGIKSLDMVKHSQAGCNQRAGRAGRMQSGVCHRMYTKADFDARPAFSTPEILRVSLADVVLKMESIGIADIEGFDFLDAPDPTAFHEASETLIALGAIRRGEKGLTEIGKAMAELPLDPKISRMVIDAKKHGCVKNVATVAAFLSVRNVFIRPKDRTEQIYANMAHERFKSGTMSDATALLNVWDRYTANNNQRSWCHQNYIQAKAMSEVSKIRTQLFDILTFNGYELTESSDPSATEKAVAMGLSYNLFEHSFRGNYEPVVRTNSESIKIHPSSSLFRRSGRFIVATEIIRTSQVFGRICTSVKEEWLPEMVPHLCKTQAQRIESWQFGASTALVSQQITYKDETISETQKEVSIAEAREIQNNAIKEARKKGWVLVTIKETTQLSNYGYSTATQLVGVDLDSNAIYNTWSHTGWQPGLTYMAELEVFLSVKRILPKFQVYDFREPRQYPGILADYSARQRVSANTPGHQYAAQNKYAQTRHEFDEGPEVSEQILHDDAADTADYIKSRPRSAETAEKPVRQFTEIENRWFKCKCGTTIKVNKATWRAYDQGGKITVDCVNCYTSGSIRREQ